MSRRQRATTPKKNHWRAPRVDRDGPDLLDVWIDDGPADPGMQAAVPPSQDYARPSAPLDVPTGLDSAGTGPLTCIRLNCPERGRPTVVERCTACGHGTALLRDFRWPRAAQV